MDLLLDNISLEDEQLGDYLDKQLDYNAISEEDEIGCFYELNDYENYLIKEFKFILILIKSGLKNTNREMKLRRVIFNYVGDVFYITLESLLTYLYRHVKRQRRSNLKISMVNDVFLHQIDEDNIEIDKW